MFRVIKTREFEEDFLSLDESEKRRVRKIMNQLKQRGDNVGKPLGRFYFREKKFGGKRLYFLVYKEFLVILALGIGNKKMQQKTINKILLELKNYESFLTRRLNKD